MHAASGLGSSTRPAAYLHLIPLSRGLNIKVLAEHCGISVQMIEKHYGMYITSDAQEQLSKLFGSKTETFTETLKKRSHERERKYQES